MEARFTSALNIFINGGSFSLNSQSLNGNSLKFTNLISLYTVIKTNQSLLQKRGDCLFILGNIKFMPDEGLSSVRLSDPTISELVNKYKTEANLSEDHYQETSDAIQLITFDQQKLLLSAILSGIFSLPVKWSTIKLGNIQFEDGNRLNDTFSSAFLKDLKAQSDLEVLSLKDIPLDSQLLSEVIQNNTKLQSLHIRLPAPMSEDFFKSVMEALYSHPNVVELGIGTLMDDSNYDYLDKLLDNNYRIKNIIFSQDQPQPRNLEKRYNRLASRLRQDSKERFIEEHLSSEVLYNLAHKSIIDNKFNTLDVLLGARNSSLSITGSKKKKEINKIKRFLPAVYHGHLEFMEDSWQEKNLDFSITLPEQTDSIGEQLIRTAFAGHNDKIIKLVLDYGVNQLKGNTAFSKFLLKKIFDSKKRHSWKKSILNYFHQELALFSPWVNQLALYVNLTEDLNKVYRHLGQYLEKLESRQHQFGFIQKLTQFAHLFEDRKGEWEHHYFHFIEGTQPSNNQLQNVESPTAERLVREHLNDLSYHIVAIIDCAKTAKRGLLKRSDLNENSVILCTKLLISINNYLRGQVNELANTLQEEREGRMQLEARFELQEAKHAEAIEGMEAKHTKEKEETEAKRMKDKEEMEAKHAEAIEGVEATRMKDKEEMEATRMKDKEEMATKIQLQIQLQLQKMMSQLSENKENGSLVNEKQQASSSRLFKMP